MIPSSKHVLLVDDEEVDRRVITQILEGAGLIVSATESYAEATRIFERQLDQIDLLISDISLPHGNGVELAKTFLKKKPTLKILLISGWVGAEIMQHHGIPPADRHFLPKPFTSAVLLERVREIFQTDDAWEWLQPSGRNEPYRASNGRT